MLLICQLKSSNGGVTVIINFKEIVAIKISLILTEIEFVIILEEKAASSID